MLTRKHFRAMARILAEKNASEDIIDACCEVFKEDNPRFSPLRFKEYIDKLKAEEGGEWI